MEGQPAHFEAHVLPDNDPKLKIEWLHNGQPLMFGSRIKTSYDFGLIILHIVSTIPEDNGEYTCIAFNDSGSAMTSGQLMCQGNFV